MTNSFLVVDLCCSLRWMRGDDGSLALTDKDKANLPNSLFATVGDKLSSLLPFLLTRQYIGQRQEVPPPVSRATID